MKHAVASGAGLSYFETLDSTSAEARRRAEAGARGPLWIVALEQTSGYGRRGAAWESAAGDVAATLLFEPGASAEVLGQLSFVAGLAVAEALAGFATDADVTLKWPNDVLIDGGKIAGILLELIDSRSATAPLVALGVGVNVVSRPDNALYPTARLLDFLEEAPPALDIVRRFDAAFDRRRRAWLREGFSPVREEFLARAARLGEQIRVQLPNETVEGVFRDIDPSGALVLECGGAERRISAGAILRTPSC
ncbi:MAG: biotin--[acetyl-CoA-carboxylase] ligase [Parvularculaceae bacterium]